MKPTALLQDMPIRQRTPIAANAMLFNDAKAAGRRVVTYTHLDVLHPLFLGGERIGTICVRSSLGRDGLARWRSA